jgi:hypothetical protein
MSCRRGRVKGLAKYGLVFKPLGGVAVDPSGGRTPQAVGRETADKVISFGIVKKPCGLCNLKLVKEARYG